jgi:hypothetical protein
VCFTRDNLWYNDDQTTDLLGEDDVGELGLSLCSRPNRPKTCTLETCKPLLSYHLDLNKNDIYVNSDKFATMTMYDWLASRRTCFDGLELTDSVTPVGRLQTLRSALVPFASMKDTLYSSNNDPYVDEVKPYYDILAVSLLHRTPFGRLRHCECANCYNTTAVAWA